ncbi:polyketide cyclase [Paraburkholderia guartelaensis]|uniref:Polyketide cyclase n=1 Tax=Paraburkholderia guartelaensis TaxID=2546446 RepID=A0A4R5LFK5_9BURK|nr:SRPBCC family protein [Paraburkholderia guartelaensis]TDG07109.1 polyketide cyclase [Paraburkholderia guartelaensis]
MAEFRLTTLWCIEAPVQPVWDAIHDSMNWPRWWKNVEAVRELQAGETDGLGAVHRYTWKGVLPYRVIIDVRVTRVAPLVALEGEASGALEGVGRWHFAADGSRTVVRYDWHVRTASAWMSALAFAPLARLVFRWNHDSIMREGGLALARLLKARFIDYSGEPR